MKKIVLSVLILIISYVSNTAMASSWNLADTVKATVDTNSIVMDTVKVTGTGDVTLTWHVSASTFPTDWLTSVAFGICDNNVCINNNVTPPRLWDDAADTGGYFTSHAYHTGFGDFHLALNLRGVSCGTHMVSVDLSDGSLGSKTITFVITKPCPSAVNQVPNHENGVKIYPNPVTNELNVAYDAAAGVKTIEVYNIIGKVMNVRKVIGSSNANINLESMPSGVYLLRLMSGTGEVVATRKFTKQ